MNITFKQKVAGVVVAGLGIVAAGVAKNVGDGIGEVVKPVVKEQVNDLVKPTSSEPAMVSKSAMVSEPNMAQIAPSFQEDYTACDDQNKQNPNVDINNSVALFEANVYCLLVQKNRGADLDKLAESDEYLKMVLDKIRKNQP